MRQRQKLRDLGYTYATIILTGISDYLQSIWGDERQLDRDRNIESWDR